VTPSNHALPEETPRLPGPSAASGCPLEPLDGGLVSLKHRLHDVLWLAGVPVPPASARASRRHDEGHGFTQLEHRPSFNGVNSCLSSSNTTVITIPVNRPDVSDPHESRRTVTHEVGASRGPPQRVDAVWPPRVPGSRSWSPTGSGERVGATATEPRIATAPTERQCVRNEFVSAEQPSALATSGSET